MSPEVGPAPAQCSVVLPWLGVKVPYTANPLSLSFFPFVGLAGILFVTNIDSSDPDQLVYKMPESSERVPGNVGDVAQNSYLGL